MQVSRKQRQLYFLRVSKNCKLLTELFIIRNEDRPNDSWFEDRHLQEVLMLLRNPIKVKVVSYYDQTKRQRRKDKENSENKKKNVKEDPEIITGQSVKIGYKFTDSYLHYNSCLMPAQMGAPVWMPDNARHAGGGFGYARLFPKKLVVHVCEYRPEAAVGATSQLMKSLSATPPSRNLAISSYFPRKSDPDFVEPNFTQSAARKHSKLKKIVKGMTNTSGTDTEDKTETKDSSDGGGFLQIKQELPDSQMTIDEHKPGVELCAKPMEETEYGNGSSADGSPSDDILCSLSTRLDRKVDAGLILSVKEFEKSEPKVLMPSQEYMEESALGASPQKHRKESSSDITEGLQDGVDLLESAESDDISQHNVAHQKSPSREVTGSATSPEKGQNSAADSESGSDTGKLSASTQEFAFQPTCRPMKTVKLSLKLRKVREPVVSEVEEKKENISENQSSEDCVLVESTDTELMASASGSKFKESSIFGQASPDNSTSNSTSCKDLPVKCQILEETNEAFRRPPASSKLSLRNRTVKGKKGPARTAANAHVTTSSSDDELMTTSFLHPVTSLRHSPAAGRDSSSSIGLASECEGPGGGRSVLPRASPVPGKHEDGESTSDYGAKEMPSLTTEHSRPDDRRSYKDTGTRLEHGESSMTPSCLSLPHEENGIKETFVAKRNSRLRRPAKSKGLLTELGWNLKDDSSDGNVVGTKRMPNVENAAKDLPEAGKPEEPLKGVKRKKDQTDDENTVREDDSELCSPSRKVHRLLAKMDDIIDNGAAAVTTEICWDLSDLESEDDEEGPEATAEGGGGTEGITSSDSQAAKGHRQEHEVIDLSQGDDEDSDHWFDSIFGDIRYVRELKEEDVAFLTKKNKGYLKSIFQGKRACERHQCYKQKGPKRLGMAGNVRLGPFREEHMDAVMGELVKTYCSRHFKYMDYISRVLLPEALTKIYMDVHGVNHAHAEEVMRGAQKEQPRK